MKMRFGVFCFGLGGRSLIAGFPLSSATIL